MLFICSQNRLRSPTAEQVFSNRIGFEVASAGLNPDAATTVSPELLEWADVIFVMERAHRNKLAKKFRANLSSKRISCSTFLTSLSTWMPPSFVFSRRKQDRSFSGADVKPNKRIESAHRVRPTRKSDALLLAAHSRRWAIKMALRFFTLAVGLLASAAAPGQEPDESRFGGTDRTVSAALACPTTVPSGANVGTYGNDVLEVIIPNRFVFRPGGAGFQAVSDGALGIKVAWNRKRKGRLAINGRRLDGTAPGARGSVRGAMSDIGFQPTYVIFPTPGCWEITGHLAGGSFSFVVIVEKIGDGPAARLDL